MVEYHINDAKTLALNYLARYSCSSAKLKQYLLKKLEFNKSTKEPEEKRLILENVENVVAYMIKLGYINDEIYAKSQFNSLLNKGKSIIQMSNKFMEKGLSKAHLNNNIKDYDSHELQMFLAIKFIKKKSLGCYYKKIDEQDMEKSMAIMYRNGFNFDVIKNVLSLEIQEADEILSKKLENV
jgi:regulatory protein